jgi:hypothetical protein
MTKGGLECYLQIIKLLNIIIERKPLTDYKEYISKKHETIAGWPGDAWRNSESDQVSPAFEIELPLEFEMDLIDCQEYPLDYISEASIINLIEMEN